MSKFLYCYPANGYIWCVLPNGKTTPPLYSIEDDKNDKAPESSKKEDNEA